MIELDPSEMIDRKAEQELFRNLISVESPARILTICDNGGRGKSTLLRRLRYNCQHEIRPAVPSGLIELDRLTDPTPFAFITAVMATLALRGEKIRESFGKFNTLDGARAQRDFTPFTDGRMPAAEFRDHAVAGRASVRRMEGGTNAGILQEVHAQYAEIHAYPSDAFSAEQEQRAREHCVEAFFDDLRTVCATRPVVLLLDGWDKCNLPLRRWLTEEMVGNNILHPNRNMRPDKFALVVAGRPRNPEKTPQGLRADEFSQFLDETEERHLTISSIASLSEWEEEHVRDFMTLNGFPEPTTAEVEVIQSRLRRGWSLEKIVTLLQRMKTDQDNEE